MKELAKSEKDMRETKEPWPKSMKELQSYIESLVKREHDYGTCVYAMSLAATATFNYVAHRLQVTGFQASCADLDILRRTRSMKGPFILLKAEDMVYPQYDLAGKLSDAMKEWEPWVAEQARKLLKEDGHENAHPIVVAHWKKLAGMVNAKSS